MYECRHAIRTWSPIYSEALHSQFGVGARPPNIIPQTIELNPYCFGQVYSNKSGIGHDYESTDWMYSHSTLCCIYDSSTKERGCLVRRGCLIDSAQLA